MNHLFNEYYLIGLSILGIVSIGTFFCRQKYITLKELRNIEYKNFEKLNNEYMEYKESVDFQNYLIEQQNLLQKNYKTEDLDDKYENCIILQKNAKLTILYNKLTELDLKIKNVDNLMKIIKNENEIHLNKYITEFKPIIKDNLLNHFLSEPKYYANIYKSVLKRKIKDELKIDQSNFDLWKSKFLNEKGNYIGSELLHEIHLNELNVKKEKLNYLFKMWKIVTQKNELLNSIYVKYDLLFNKYSKLWYKFVNNSNELINNELVILNKNIENELIKQEKILNLINENKDMILYFNKYKNSKNLIENNQNIFHEKIYFNNEKEFLYFKNYIWNENNINCRYLNSNTTHFWICYDEFWKNVKQRMINPWKFKVNISLNLIDTKDSVSDPIIDLNQYLKFNSELNNLNFELNVFYLQIFLVNNSNLLKLLIFIGYSLVITLIVYILYKKIKFVYNCWKTKTLKITFLNWLFDPEILFVTSKLGMFYWICMFVLLGVLYNISGLGYWFTFLFCGRVFIWNWIKFGIYKLNEKWKNKK